MSESYEQPNPSNPLCPVCGAADWFQDTRWTYVLHAVHSDTGLKIMANENDPMVFPFEGAVCRICRFIRLRSAAGTLTPVEN